MDYRGGWKAINENNFPSVFPGGCKKQSKRCTCSRVSGHQPTALSDLTEPCQDVAVLAGMSILSELHRLS